MSSKAWWRSKTIWFNAAALSVEVLGVAQASLPKLEGLLPPKLYAFVALALPPANMIIRRFTRQAIHFRGPKRPPHTAAVRRPRSK